MDDVSMTTHPRLETERLLLRRIEMGDAGIIQRLAGEYAVAAMTLNIPYPYPPDAAEIYISATHDAMIRGAAFNLAIEHAGELVGNIGITIQPEHNLGELGYWIGKPYWNQGFAGEAARRVLALAFDTLLLNRVYARCFAVNIASERVMQKAGMHYEGTLRQHIRKWGDYHDLKIYGILRSEYEAAQENTS